MILKNELLTDSTEMMKLINSREANGIDNFN